MKLALAASIRSMAVLLLWVLPVVAQTWNCPPPLQLPSGRGRADVQAAMDLYGRIYVPGGNQNGTSVADCLRFDETTGLWTTIPPMITPRSSHGVASDYRGRIYAIGGCTGPGPRTNLCERFDSTLGPGAWQSIAPLPLALCYVRAVASSDGRSIFAVGGQDNTPIARNVAYRFDVATGTWALDASPLLARSGPFGLAMVPQTGEIFACGGSSTLRLEKRDPVTGQWSNLGSVPFTEKQIGSAVADQLGYIYFFVNDGTVRRYDAVSNTWLATSLGTERNVASIISRSNRLCRIGGDAASRTVCYAALSDPARTLRLSFKRVLDANGQPDPRWTSQEILRWVRGADVLLRRTINVALTTGEVLDFRHPTQAAAWFDVNIAQKRAMERSAEEDPCTFFWRTNAVNVYLVRSLTGGNSGYCSFPDRPFDDDDLIFLSPLGTGAAWNGQRLLAHELGHYLSLYHTHETQFGVEQHAMCGQSSNCAVAGDLVCDTAADPGPGQQCADTLLRTWHPPATCQAIFDALRFNVMSYYCGIDETNGILTSGQSARVEMFFGARRYVTLSGAYIVPSCTFRIGSSTDMTLMDRARPNHLYVTGPAILPPVVFGSGLPMSDGTQFRLQLADPLFLVALNSSGPVFVGVVGMTTSLGEAGTVFNIPNDPTLPGTRIFWQTAILGQPLLEAATNVVPTIIQ